MPQLSVIIPTYNRVNQLQKVLQGLAAQSLPAEQFEVIVISDGSTDGTHDYLNQACFPFHLHAIIQQNQGPAEARNRGVQEAKAGIFLFLDDDVFPDPELLRVHLECQLASGPNQIVIGSMLTPHDITLSPWVVWEQTLLERYYRQMADGTIKTTAREFFTGNVSIKKAFFQATGGFDTAFRRAEDVEFAFRAERLGATFTFNPDAKGYHYAERSFNSWQQIAYLYGKYDVVFTQEKGVDYLLPAKMKEYHWRHPLIRLLVPVCLDRKLLQAVAIRFFQWLGIRSFPQNRGVSCAAFSAIYNLRYYQGISDQLGGRRIFFSLVRQAK